MTTSTDRKGDGVLPNLDAATPEQTERASAAVEANLNDDGSPKYDSAQGYACALTAIMQADATRQTTASDEDVVERVARALYEHSSPASSGFKAWASINEGQRNNFRAKARAAVAVTPDLSMVRDALEPFASIDPEEYDGAPDDMSIERAIFEGSQPTVGDLRKARAAYAALPTPEKVV